jgi:hypothetical protein
MTSLLDANQDQQIQATEVRQAVQSAVKGLFASADTNRDGQLSPSEVNAAMAGMVKTIAQAGFQAADTDHNGALSQAEFEKAVIEPARVVFNVVDGNHDGQITPQEAQTAERVLATRIRMLSVPEPSNSLRNLIRSGRTPSEAAPVPNFGTPVPGRATRGTQPLPAPAPAPAPAPPQ